MMITAVITPPMKVDQHPSPGLTLNRFWIPSQTTIIRSTLARSRRFALTAMLSLSVTLIAPDVVAQALGDYLPQRNLNIPESLPTGIWSDGSILYVAAGFFNGRYIRSYRFSDGMRQSRFNLTHGSFTSFGIWSDGTTMWVADDFRGLVYAYTLASGSRDEDRNINLVAENDQPISIWSDGSILWVVNLDEGRLHAYVLDVAGIGTAVPSSAQRSD